MTAEVRRDDVSASREAFGDFAPAVREIEKAVDENECRVAGAVPVEEVIGEARRERESS